MFTSKELELLSLSLVAMKDLAQVDLMVSGDDFDFRRRVEAEIVEIDTLMSKVKSLI